MIDPPRRARSFASGFAVLLMLGAPGVGCSKDESKGAAGQETPTAEVPASDPGAARPAPPRKAGPEVTLLEAGAEPRQLLRLAAAKGTTQTVRLTMTMDMDLVMNGAPTPKAKLPVMVMAMSVTVADVESDGDIRWEMKLTEADVVDDPEVMPMVMSATRDALRGVVGLGGYAVLSPRGFIKEGNMALPPDANPQLKQMLDGMQQSLDQMTSPLPEEPVGVGGKWQVKQTLEQNGMRIDQTGVYTITKIEGSHVLCDIDLRQTAAQQKIQMPGMPPGVDAEVLSLTTSGGGATEIDLTRIVPTHGRVQGLMDMTTRVSMSGQTQNMAMKMKIELAIDAAGAE
jgi:hypothetical protein